MNGLDFTQANIKNLEQLWRCMGTESNRLPAPWQQSISWPSRCWPGTLLNSEQLNNLLKISHLIAPHYIVPIVDRLQSDNTRTSQILEAADFSLHFQQTGMYLDLTNNPNLPAADLTLDDAKTHREITQWTQIASDSFGYDIDQKIIMSLLQHEAISLLLAFEDTRPVATGLVFQTGNTLGVHQVGVLPSYRGRGLARRLMQAILYNSQQQPVTQITLQASAMGEPLYRSLGFQPSFLINNYKKNTG